MVRAIHAAGGTEVRLPGAYIKTPTVSESIPQLLLELPILERRTIYMNRLGGIFQPGYNHSGENTSTIPNETSVIAPWTVSDTDWQMFMTCTREMWAPFNVRITDTDPGHSVHIESVVAGYPQDLGFEQNFGGVAPFNCDGIDRAIVFTFAQLYTDHEFSPLRICETAAQEVGHAMAVDHQLLCTDPMSYLGGCGDKRFRNQRAPCGEFAPRECACGGSSQNTMELLIDANGPGASEPPVLLILSPQDNQVVEPGFIVEIEATDDFGVLEMEVLIDGQHIAFGYQRPYSIPTPNNLADGAHTLTVRISDGAHIVEQTLDTTVHRMHKIHAPDQLSP